MLWDTTTLEFPYQSRELTAARHIHDYSFRDQVGHNIDRPCWIPTGGTHENGIGGWFVISCLTYIGE